MRIVAILIVFLCLTIFVATGIYVVANHNNLSIPTIQNSSPSQGVNNSNSSALALAKQKLTNEKADWTKYAANEWSTEGYKRYIASGMYAPKTIDDWLISVPDSKGLLQKVKKLSQSAKDLPTLVSGTIKIIESIGLTVVKVEPSNISNQNMVSLPDGSFEYNPIASKSNFGVFTNHSVKSFDTKKNISYATPSKNNIPNYNTKPTIFLNASTTDLASTLKTLLHEYGHYEEEMYGKSISYVDQDGVKHAGQPSSEFISTIYGISSGEILEKFIGAQAASELIFKQILLNRWISVGNIENL